MNELTIRATRSTKPPNYRKTAAELLAAAREFYQNPENEKAFREWLNEQKKERKDA